MIVQRILIALPSTHLAERGIRHVATLVNKKEKSVFSVTERDELLFFNKIVPDINKRFKMYQIYPSH